MRVVSFLLAGASAVCGEFIASPELEVKGPVITRYDVPDPRNKFRLEPTSFQANVSTGSRVVSGSAPNPFRIDFNCSASQELCNWALEGYSSAFRRIAQYIYITNTINVKASFYPFCGAVPASSCSESNTLGQATSAAYFSARTSAERDFSFFPQPLIKQLNTKYDLQFFRYDIITEFNSEMPFWFASSGRAIRPSEFDFEFVVIHEVLHGLGINTRLFPLGELAPRSGSADWLTPFVNANQDDTLISWQPVSVFDTFLYDIKNDRTISNWTKVIYNYRINPGTSLDSFISGFKKSGDPFTAAQRLYLIAGDNANNVVFQGTINGTTYRVTVATANPYSSGSSIAHLDYDSYWRTSDFMMIPAVQNLKGLSLDTIIERATGDKFGPFGPRTLMILSMIGWPTLISNEKTDVEITNDLSAGTAGGVAGSISPIVESSVGRATVSVIVLIVSVAVATLY